MSEIEPSVPETPAYSTETPNVVLQNPYVRKVLNVVVGTAAIVVPVITIIDARVDAFDITAFTDAAATVTSFLAGLLAVAVTAPNIPKRQ
jgi:hypothetical protein